MLLLTQSICLAFPNGGLVIERTSISAKYSLLLDMICLRKPTKVFPVSRQCPAGREFLHGPHRKAVRDGVRPVWRFWLGNQV